MSASKVGQARKVNVLLIGESFLLVLVLSVSVRKGWVPVPLCRVARRNKQASQTHQTRHRTQSKRAPRPICGDCSTGEFTCKYVLQTADCRRLLVGACSS